MALQETFVVVASALLVIAVGVGFGMPLVFAGRVMPYRWIENLYIGGVAQDQLPGVVNVWAAGRQTEKISLTLRGKTIERRLADLGLSINIVASGAAQAPVWQIDRDQLQHQIANDFQDRLTLTADASLRQLPNKQLELVKSASGEGIELASVESQLRVCLRQAGCEPIQLTVGTVVADVTDNEVEMAKALAMQLLHDGLTLHLADKNFEVKPFTITRLLRFAPVADRLAPTNKILGVQFDAEEFKKYLATTISPDINQEAQDARFEIEGDDLRVNQFTEPKTGQQLDLDMTTAAVQTALASGGRQADLAVITTRPAVGSVVDASQLGISALLARGETDFRGSPRNRIHNITVGTARYQGLLIPPNAEFSFDFFLGPVDGEHGFLPELVIKHNVTTPEFGGGLCQVSTTVFRTAVLAGLKITARRNHAYAVRYYGKPGFDATIYPPYTDLRFLNNTPGYILIATHIDGTKLAFEFWGTNDGRRVEIEGPTTYARQSNGAIKAVLKQKVTQGDQVIIEDTFNSNYQSPDLFPHALHEQPPITAAPAAAPAEASAKAGPTPTKKAIKPKPTPAPESVE